MTQKRINNYLIYLEQVLGKGSFGCVYRGQQDGTKQSVAVKIIQKTLIDHDEYMKSALFSEIQILQLLKSENVVRVFDVLESSHNYYIVQELCESDLQRMLNDSKKLTEQNAVTFLTQICNGFMALVKEGIVHRDVKPANLLLNKGKIKIGDFGFAKKSASNRMKNMTSVGTPLYMSPQVLKSQQYTSKCDIWATGFIFYEMLHGHTPWTARSQFQLVKNIQTKPLQISLELSHHAQDFLRRSLALSEQDRLSWDEVFMHPIFKGAFNSFAEQNQQFENRLKALMTELRFRINSLNIDLQRLLENLGFEGAQQLSSKQFQRFVRHIHPHLTRPQIRFFFQKMDQNADGVISIVELASQMQKYRISFSRLKLEGMGEEAKMRIKKTESLECFQSKKISSELEIRVRKCFQKLYRILKNKKITLYRTFQAYGQEKPGALTLPEFEKILIQLDPTFTTPEVQEIFAFVDLDSSKTIEFQELKAIYCKINGIPQTLQDPNFHASHSNSHSHSKHSHSKHSHSKHEHSNHEHSKHHEHSNHHHSSKHIHEHSNHKHHHHQNSSHHHYEHSTHHDHEHSNHISKDRENSYYEHSHHSHHEPHHQNPSPHGN